MAPGGPALGLGLPLFCPWSVLDPSGLCTLTCAIPLLPPGQLSQLWLLGPVPSSPFPDGPVGAAALGKPSQGT